MKGLCRFFTALYKMRAPQLSVTTLTRRKQAKLLKKKKKKTGCFKAPHAHSMVVEGHLLQQSPPLDTLNILLFFFYCFVFYFAL